MNLLAAVALLYLTLSPLPLIAAEASACAADFQRLCPDMPPGRELYTLCFTEHRMELSPECSERLGACQDNPKDPNPLLNPPSSAQDVRFLRCGVSDQVVFRVRRPYPDHTVADLMLSRWQGKGWLPKMDAADSWKTVVSPDRLRVAFVRSYSYENSKKQTASLVLAYYKKLQEPVIPGMPLDHLDVGDDLHVQASLTPVR